MPAGTGVMMVLESPLYPPGTAGSGIYLETLAASENDQERRRNQRRPALADALFSGYWGRW